MKGKMVKVICLVPVWFEKYLLPIETTKEEKGARKVTPSPQIKSSIFKTNVPNLRIGK